MQQRARERIYILITVFCLIMCAFLLVSVFLDIPIATVSHTKEVHAPFMPARVEAVATELPAPEQNGQGITMTDEYLAQQMAAFLPGGFPVSQVGVHILGSGGFELAIEMKRSALKSYLADSGVKLGLRQSIALGLLPDSLSVDTVFTCMNADKSGAALELESLRVNGKSVNTDFLPKPIFDVLSGAINAVMAYNNFDWSGVIFSDGALRFGN